MLQRFFLCAGRPFRAGRITRGFKRTAMAVSSGRQWPKPPKLQAPVVELGKELLDKVKAWRIFWLRCVSVSEDAKEAVWCLEAAKFQIHVEQEFATQLSNDSSSQSKEACSELLKAQAVDDISWTMWCINQIVDYLDQFIEECEPKRGSRPKGLTNCKSKSKATLRHNKGHKQKQGHQGSKTKRASDKTIAPKGMGKREASTNSTQVVFLQNRFSRSGRLLRIFPCFARVEPKKGYVRRSGKLRRRNFPEPVLVETLRYVQKFLSVVMTTRLLKLTPTWPTGLPTCPVYNIIKIPFQMEFGKPFLLPLTFLFRVIFSHNRLAPTTISLDDSHIRTSKGISQRSSDYAYTWVLGGIHEDKPSYKGLCGQFWSLEISPEGRFRRRDFWVYARLSPNSTLDDLSDEEKQIFRALDVNVILLDKPKKESFAQVVYDKFLTINMTDYKRVMFLDGDMMPMTNLDYIFHLSDPDYQDTPTLLRPNFIMATRGEPCNTGVFMVEPSLQNFQKYLGVVRRQHQSAKKLPYPHFDWEKGWGHSFKETRDFWESVNMKGKQQWRWHASHSDQGLMYMYAKYVLGEVSIAIGERVQNWRRGSGERVPVKESEARDLFIPFQGKILRHQHSCDSVDGRRQNRFWRCNPPYDSTAHFMGKEKPWLGQYVIQKVVQASGCLLNT